MASKGSHDRPPDAGDVAGYVASMAKELKRMIDPHRMTALAYLLDQVREEAEAREKEARGFPPRGER